MFMPKTRKKEALKLYKCLTRSLETEFWKRRGNIIHRNPSTLNYVRQQKENWFQNSQNRLKGSFLKARIMVEEPKNKENHK
jgi:hypothetical protein